MGGQLLFINSGYGGKGHNPKKVGDGASSQHVKRVFNYAMPKDRQQECIGLAMRPAFYA